MPVFTAELSDGRMVDVEADSLPSEQDIMAAVGKPPAPIPPMETPRVPVSMPSPLAAIPFPSGTAPTIPASPTESLMRPTFEALKATSTPEQGPVAGVSKGLWNLGVGIPEFATSTAGMAAAVTAPIFPRVTSGVFTVDIFRNLIKQIPEIAKEWNKLSLGQQAQAATEVIGGALLGTALGAKTVKGWGRQPLGEASETQRQAVQFTQELAQKDPAKFEQLAKDAVSKAAAIEQREPEVKPTLPIAPQPEEKKVEQPAATAAELKGVPDAIEERQVQAGVQPERVGTEAQRVSPETGVGDRVQPAAEVTKAEAPRPVGPEKPEVLLGKMTPDEAVRSGADRGDYYRAVGDAFRNEQITEEEFKARSDIEPSKWPTVKVGEDVYVPQWHNSGRVTDIGYGWVEVMNDSFETGRQPADLETLASYNKRHERKIRPIPENAPIVQEPFTGTIAKPPKPPAAQPPLENGGGEGG